MPNDEVTTFYDTLGAAKYLGIGSDTVRLYARQGKIEHFRRGRRLCFTPNQLNKFMKGEK